jgi:hypothetical protein
MSKPKAIHRTRHLNIRKDDPNIQSVFEYGNCFDCVGSFDHLKPGLLNGGDSIPPEQGLVVDNEHDGSVARLDLH